MNGDAGKLGTVTNGMKISNSHCKRASLISDLGLFSRAYSLGLRLTARGSIRLMETRDSHNPVRPGICCPTDRLTWFIIFQQGLVT